MTGPFAPPDLRAIQRGIFLAELMSHCRAVAANLCGSIVQARARGEDTAATEAKLDVVLDYEQKLASALHGKPMPRHEPRWPQAREGEA